MLSKSIEGTEDEVGLIDILRLVGKNPSAKALKKRTQAELDEAERWAIIYNAAMNGHSTPPVPKQPEWLWKM